MRKPRTLLVLLPLLALCECAPGARFRYISAARNLPAGSVIEETDIQIRIAGGVASTMTLPLAVPFTTTRLIELPFRQQK